MMRDDVMMRTRRTGGVCAGAGRPAERVGWGPGRVHPGGGVCCQQQQVLLAG